MRTTYDYVEDAAKDILGLAAQMFDRIEELEAEVAASREHAEDLQEHLEGCRWLNGQLREKVTALEGELVDAELAAAEETMPDQMTGGAAMSELRAPDPTLTALDQRWDVVSIEEGLPPTAHRDAVALLEPPDVFSRQPARDARWFAVPCRKCFPDAPPPGREFYNLMDQRNRVQVRTRPVKGLAWQVQP